MSVSSFSDYESDDEFIVIPKDKNEELPCLLNGTKRRKPTLESYVAPQSMRDTVYRCKEFPQGIYIDRFGKAQPDDQRTGVFVEKDNEVDDDEEDSDDSGEDEEEDAQRFITASPEDDNDDDDDKELNNIWLSKIDEDYEDSSPKSVKRRKVEEKDDSLVTDDNWIQYMSEEQRKEYEKTIQAMETGHVRQKRLQQLNRVLSQTQTFEELMEPLVKSKKYATLLKYRVDQNLFGSCLPYSIIEFKHELIHNAYVDITTANVMWNDQAYKNVETFVHDLIHAADNLKTHTTENFKLPKDLINIIKEE